MHSVVSSRTQPQGFTLVELLVVIGIIVILFAVVLVAVDPAKRLAQARDAVRRQDVRNILEGVEQYIVDNNGDTSGLGVDASGTTYEQIGTAGSGCDSGCTAQTTNAACADLTPSLVDAYLSEIPKDPETGTDAETAYYINLTATGRVVVGACSPEIATTIEVKR